MRAFLKKSSIKAIGQVTAGMVNFLPNKLSIGDLFLYFQKLTGLRLNNLLHAAPGRASILNSIAFPILLLGLLSLEGCSSDPLLDIAKPTEKPFAPLSTRFPYATATLGLFDITTFDVYVDDDIIHLFVGGKISADDKHIKLRYSRSEDGGHHWQDPINLGAVPTTIASRGNDIQLAAKGKYVVAIWQTKGELPGMGPMASAYSRDSGLTWKQGANPAVNNAGDQSHIDIIADEHGHFHMAWLEDPEENGYQSLRYARSENNGKQWSSAATLDGSTCSCCWNTLAISPQNELNILYRDMKPRDMTLLQSKDNGNTWQHISTVGEFGWQFDGCPHVGGSLTYGGTNNPELLHSLVWTGVEQKAGLYYLNSDDAGSRWSAPQKLGNTAIHANIANHDDTVVAIWDEMEADGSSIFYSKSENSGLTWLTAIRLSSAKNAATHPRLIATKHGFLALWTEQPSKKASQLAWQFIE